MAYRFKAGETVPENIRRIAFEEIDSAIDQLRNSGPRKRDTAIHEARKSIKKLRGVLKLMRPELGAAYREQNDALRNIGRQLSELRDASAIIETFGGTLDKHEGKLQKNGLTSIRKGLELDKREKERSHDVIALMKRAANALAAFRRQVPKWPLSRDGFDAIAPGLQETYRRGRKAMRAAEDKDKPEFYHQWRKRVKDHWYHVRLLESLWTEAMQARENSLHDLETWLGDDHNLVVLNEQLANRNGHYGDVEGVRLFNTLAEARQKQLREDALSLGERLYEEKPKRFRESIRRLWDAWQEQPESMKERAKVQRTAGPKQPPSTNPRRSKKSAA